MRRNEEDEASTAVTGGFITARTAPLRDPLSIWYQSYRSFNQIYLDLLTLKKLYYKVYYHGELILIKKICNRIR